MTFKVAPPPNIRLEIAAALLTAGRAESAYAEGNSREAQTLCDETERRVRTTLGHICELTEGEADAIEPAFSEL